jgi:hypothetical protein
LLVYIGGVLDGHNERAYFGTPENKDILAA